VLDSIEVPLALSALVFAALAAWDWRRLPVCGRVHLGVATAFALGALAHPGMAVGEALQGSPDGVAYLVAAARVAGLTAALVSIAAFVRELSFR
jgi:hypothetical protein